MYQDTEKWREWCIMVEGDGGETTRGKEGGEGKGEGDGGTGSCPLRIGAGLNDVPYSLEILCQRLGSSGDVEQRNMKGSVRPPSGVGQ